MTIDYIEWIILSTIWILSIIIAVCFIFGCYELVHRYGIQHIFISFKFYVLFLIIIIIIGIWLGYVFSFYIFLSSVFIFIFIIIILRLILWIGGNIYEGIYYNKYDLNLQWLLYIYEYDFKVLSKCLFMFKYYSIFLLIFISLNIFFKEFENIHRYLYYIFDFYLNNININNNISYAYKLNFKYNNIYKCNICSKKFNINEKQTLLKCGHRYCTCCINRYEKIQRQNNYHIKNTNIYNCPLKNCSSYYSTNTKWKYNYCIDNKYYYTNENINLFIN